MTTLLTTERLLVRDWEVSDSPAALAIFGDERVSRWLTPAVDPVPDEQSMGDLLTSWRERSQEADDEAEVFVGRWALVRSADGVVVGALVLRTMPPHEEDVEVAWQLAPDHWGEGYASEGVRGLSRWAFDRSVSELFAVVKPGNERSASIAQRLGMEWVGETQKYYDQDLQVYRLRPGDLPSDKAATGRDPATTTGAVQAVSPAPPA